MKLLKTLAFVCLCVPMWGQGYRYDSNAFTSANNVPPGSQSTLFTIPFAKITVCAYPDNGGQPCTNTVPIYQDPALTVTAQNPITADVHGRFGFWKAAGFYTFSVVSPGGEFLGTYIISLGGAGGETTVALTTNGISGPSTLTGNPAAGYLLNVPDYQTTAFETQVIPPIGGQFVVVYPTTGTITSDPVGNGVIGPQGGDFEWNCSGILCTIAATTNANWSGFVLPDYVNPANVTAVYADGVSSASELLGAMPSGGANQSKLSCTGMVGTETLFPSYGTPTNPWSLFEGTVHTTLTGAQVATATCSLQLGPSNSNNSGMAVNLPALRLLVYYSGPAPPARTAIDVVSPLAYNPSALTLSDDAVQVDSINGVPGAFTFTGSGVSCTTTTCTFGGGGAVSSVANSDGTLTISPTTGSVIASLALGHANIWTGKQTQPAPLFSDLTGLTQCLHINTSGQVSGTGSDCGAGAGTITGSGTTNYYSLWTGTTALGNGHLDDGVTTAATITSSEPIAVAGSTHGVVIPAGTAVAGAAGKVIYASDATSGFAEVNENNTGLSRVCTAANGICAGGSPFITSLTTTGSSGAATVSSGVLNVPVYSGGGGNTTSTALTTNVLPKANGANSVINSGLTDSGSTLSYAGSGSTNAIGFPASSVAITPIAANAIYGSDASGNAVISENGAAATRACTAGNGVCTGTAAYVNITGVVTATGCTVSAGKCVVGSAVATLSFSSIPGTYTTLKLSCTYNSSSAGANGLYMQFNGDTTADYVSQLLFGVGSTASALGSGAVSHASFLTYPGSTSGSSPAVADISIPLYAGTAFTKTAFATTSRWASGTQAVYQDASLMWLSTSAITSLSIADISAGNIVAGSTCSIYGVQ